MIATERFAPLLLKWYADNGRTLPWRNIADPYRIWISEIILQQTQVKQGYDYYLRFIDAFPTVFDLAKADEDEVKVPAVATALAAACKLRARE